MTTEQEIVERRRHISAHPEDMTEAERWWRTMGKEEQRINGMRNGAMRRAKKRGIKLSLAEIRVMTEEKLREMFGG